MTRPSAVRSIKWVQHAEQQRAISGRLRDFLVEAVPMALGFESKAAKDKRTSPLRNAMLEHVPVVIANSAKDEARQLLQAGAEIEHALLIEYLYAAFSLRRSAVRKTLINIAVQEMSHLIAVQNLLLFLGAAPYFERYDISPNPEFDPFPFGLNSFQHSETLERFVLAEMPMLDTLKGDDQATIIEIQKRLDP